MRAAEGREGRAVEVCRGVRSSGFVVRPPAGCQFALRFFHRPQQREGGREAARMAEP